MTRGADGSDLVVIIVNYCTARLVIDCLASLAPQIAEHPAAQVVVVDNASPDGSADMLDGAIADSGWCGWARVHRSPVNGGFAYGNNLAVRAVIAEEGRGRTRELFWLLNPDTLVRPGSVAGVLAFLHAHPAVGVIGTAIDDEAGHRWPYAFRFHSLLGEVENALRLSIVTRLLGRYSGARAMNDEPTRVDWVSGASMVIRRSVFETAGLFDECYFLYFEETDFFRAVARAGWECWYVPQAVVIHMAGQSTGVTGKDAGRRRVPPYWFASRRRYLVKNHGRLYGIAADLIVVAGLILWRARCAVTARPHGGSPAFLRDFVRHSALMRRTIQANDRLNDPRCQFAEAGSARPLPVREA